MNANAELGAAWGKGMHGLSVYITIDVNHSHKIPLFIYTGD
jgi:hypothetical protein